MRYIYIVAGLILTIAVISGMTLLKPKPPLSSGALSVNGHIITVEEYRKAYEEKASTCPVPPDKRKFVDDLVTKEILIQEAERLGLDREEQFRRSIQNYYEQTLLKNLTQKKASDIKVSASDQEIRVHYENMGKVYELSVVTVPTEGEANEAIKKFPSERAEKKSLHGDEFPPGMLESVLSRKVGEVSLKPVQCDQGFLVYRLDGYKKEPVPPLAEVREEIRKSIDEKKRQAEMERWLEGLKRNSRVTINEQLTK